MELYDFFRGLFAWTVADAVLWPLNVPMLALAFKIQTGAKRLPFNREQLWWRSTFAALFLGLTAIAFTVLDYLLVAAAEFPAGPVHLVAFAGFVPVAAWILFVMFAHSELFEGLGLFVIYIYLPTFVLFVVNQLLGIWNPLLNYAYEWIKPVV